MKLAQHGYSDIAKATGKTEGAVRVDVSRKRFDIDSLKSVAIYVVFEILRRGAREMEYESVGTSYCDGEVIDEK